MKSIFRKFLINIAALVLIWQGIQFEVPQKVCIELFVKIFTPYNVAALDIKVAKKFPFQADIQALTLTKNHDSVATLKNIFWKVPDLFFKDIVLGIEEFSFVKKTSSLEIDFPNVSPALIGHFLQNLSEKLKRFLSVDIKHLYVNEKDLSLHLESQGLERVITLSHKGQNLILKVNQSNDYSILRLDGFWEGQQLLANAKIGGNIIDLSLKANTRSFANEHLVNFLGEEVTLDAHLEKLTSWQLRPLKIVTSAGHILEGECVQKKDKLDGYFIWNMPLPGAVKLTKCHILIEGSSNHPTIKWDFKEGIESLEEISGECTFIDSNNVKFFGHLQHNIKNTALVKMDVSLNPFLINGKIAVASPDLQKLLHLFMPSAQGSLNLEAFFENVSSLDRGHIAINGQGTISDTSFHLPIDVKVAIHNGLGAGELHLTKGHYQQLPVDAHIAFNSTSKQIEIEKCKVQWQGLQLNLLKPVVYHFEQGLSRAQMQFCSGMIEIEQLKFGHTLAGIISIIKLHNIQLHGLKVFFEGHDIVGILNGKVQKLEGKPLTIKLDITKGFWQQHQDKHTYKILNNLRAVFDAHFEENIWKWDLKIKDLDKVNFETYGKTDLKNSTIDAYAKGLIRLKLLTDWLATDDRIFGDVSIDLRAIGQISSPTLDGSVNVDNGLYEHSEVGTFYQNIVIRTKAQGKRLIVTRFDAQDVTKSTEPDHGNLRGEGWVDFSQPFSPVFNVPMHLFHLRIAQNDGFISDASGTLMITGKGAEVGCKGEVTLENVRYFIESSVDSKIPKIIDRSLKKDKIKQEKSYATAFPLDILVHNPPGSFKVIGSGADTVWKGDFYVRKSIVNPFLVGTVHLHEGSLDILGKVLHITHGEITFIDNDRNNPRLNIRAIKKLEDGVIVAIEIKGTGNNTIIDFTSIPSMPKEEVLALLLFGKKLGEVSVLQSVQLAELAKSDNDQRGFFEQMRSNFGFDQFEFKTTTHGGASATDEDATPQERAEAKTSQAVRIGKEFGKIQVAIEQGAGSETSKLIVSTPLGKNLALQGDVGAAQNSGVGVSWVKRY